MRKFTALLIAALICLCSCGEAVNVNTGRSEDYAAYTDISGETRSIVINTNSMTVHMPDCIHAARIADKNRLKTDYNYIDNFLDRGYNKCKVCFTESTDESNFSED